MTRFALDALTEAVKADVAAHGLRPTAERRGLPLSILRGAIDQRNLTADSLMELAQRYDMEFYVGPRRADGRTATPEGSFSGIDAPVYGWASCGPKGEGPTRAERDRRLPVPADLDPASLFYAIAKGNSMRQEGIPSGSYALIDSSRTAAVGDRVWFRDVVGLTALKRLTAIDGDGVTLRGWMTADAGRVASFDITVTPVGIDQLYPVIAVFDRPPVAGKETAILPDPRATEFRRNTTIDSRIAAALGIDDQADQDTIIETIERLKQAAKNAPPIAELSRDIDALSDTLGAMKRWIKGND